MRCTKQSLGADPHNNGAEQHRGSREPSRRHIHSQNNQINIQTAERNLNAPRPTELHLNGADLIQIAAPNQDDASLCQRLTSVRKSELKETVLIQRESVCDLSDLRVTLRHSLKVNIRTDSTVTETVVIYHSLRDVQQRGGDSMLDSVLISLFTSFFPDKTGRLQAKKIFDRKLKKRYDDEIYVFLSDTT